jgi:hypothetical protein
MRTERERERERERDCGIVTIVEKRCEMREGSAFFYTWERRETPLG